jgi:hypothetical protein
VPRCQFTWLGPEWTVPGLDMPTTGHYDVADVITDHARTVLPADQYDDFDITFDLATGSGYVTAVPTADPWAGQVIVGEFVLD